MHYLIDTMRQYPEIAIFLTLALGFWFGSLKFGSFSLGAVTSTLLAGLLVGQLDESLLPRSICFWRKGVARYMENTNCRRTQENQSPASSLMRTRSTRPSMARP